MTAKLKLLLWLCLVASAIVAMHQVSGAYTLNDVREALDSYYVSILLGYAALICIRGLLFIPTLPFIVLMANALEPKLMFAVTLAASCASAYLVCFTVDHLEIQRFLDKLPQKSLHRGQRAIQSFGVAAVAGWAFFPLVFTEIIVYLARLSDMSRRQIVAAVAVGEGLMIACLISLTQWFSQVIL